MASAIRLSDPTSPTFVSSQILKRQVLNYASLEDNSNKFYIAELQQGNGSYPFRIYTEYGRLGKSPRQEGRYYSSRWQAESDYDDIIEQKLGKGYKKIEVDDGFSLSSPIRVVKGSKTKPDLSGINDKVLKLIGKLYQEATSYLISSITTPLGKLSIAQVTKGLQILEEIERVLDGGGYRDFRYLSNEFYSVIPIEFGHKVDMAKFMIDSYDKLNDKKDLLGVMNSVVRVQDSLEKTLEDKYKALNIKLKALSSRSNEYKRLADFVLNNKGYNHHFNMKVLDIYEVEDMINYHQFNPFKVSTLELFHGTRNENMLSIMQNGLKIKPASAVKSGSMFGQGVYFANTSTKSANYCWGFSSGDPNESYFLLVCDVATGKIKKYSDAQPQLVSAPRGYNSVMGVKGSSLLHDEIIVYHENQIKIKYIVEFKKR